MIKFFILLFALLLSTEPAGAWFLWGDGDKVDEAEIPVKGKTADRNFHQVGFEMLTHDERIQKELAAIKEMSPMGSCYYRVLEDLKQSCGSLSEEEIGKMSVQLLNCQSEVENRRTYRCTKYMTVGECTADMDATVWNSYQIVSNRARAICYQVRQQQFKIKTELTVDKLVQSSEFQLNNLKQMQDRHSQLKSLTDEALSSLSEGQDRLKRKQEGMETLQTSMEEHMALSLEQLQQQKVLAEEGVVLIGTMAERVQDKLDSVTERLQQKDAQLASNQDRLLADLHLLRSVAESVGGMLVETQTVALEERAVSRDQHRDVISSLERINETAVYVARVLLEVKVTLEGQLDWIYRLLEETGTDLNDLKTIGLHVVYILLTMLTLSFLGAEAPMRWISIFVLVINCILTIHVEAGLQPIQLTLSFVSICAGRWTLGLMMNTMSKNKKSIQGQPSNKTSHTRSALSTPDIKKVIEVLENYKKQRKESFNMEKISEEASPYFPPQTPPPPSPSNHLDFKPVATAFSAKRSLLRNMEEGYLRERSHKSLSPSTLNRAPRSETGLRVALERKNMARLRRVSPSRYSRSRSPSRQSNQNVTKKQSAQKSVEEQGSP